MINDLIVGTGLGRALLSSGLPGAALAIAYVPVVPRSGVLGAHASIIQPPISLGATATVDGLELSPLSRLIGTGSVLK